MKLCSTRLPSHRLQGLSPRPLDSPAPEPERESGHKSPRILASSHSSVNFPQSHYILTASPTLSHGPSSSAPPPTLSPPYPPVNLPYLETRLPSSMAPSALEQNGAAVRARNGVPPAEPAEPAQEDPPKQRKTFGRIPHSGRCQCPQSLPETQQNSAPPKLTAPHNSIRCSADA